MALCRERNPEEHMRTVTKALSILDLFSETTPSLILSEIARLSGLDPATAHRMTKSLVEHGYLEKSVGTKVYTLGAAVLRLARCREATMPMERQLQTITDALAEQSGESAHASLIAGNHVATVAVREGGRANRVHVDYGGRLELHATATGLACLAFARESFAEPAFEKLLAEHTRFTITDAAKLRAEIEIIRKQGYSVADRSFDEDVVGIAAPIFGGDGFGLGAIAVATPASRVDASVRKRTAQLTMAAAIEATRQFAGKVPPSYPGRSAAS